jgi:Tol biopolymer transport system component
VEDFVMRNGINLAGAFLLILILAACTTAELAPTMTSVVVPEDTPIAETPTAVATNPVVTTEPTPTPTVTATNTVPSPTETPAEQATATPEPNLGGGAPDDPPSSEVVPILVRPEQWRPGLGDIAVLWPDGSGLKLLTTYHYNADPVLSPDGQRIAYRSVPSTITSLPEPGPRLSEGYYNIWVITTDGEQAWQLTSSEAARSVPSWSADSQRVIFSQGESGELVEVDVDLQDRRVITQSAFNPKVRPDGSGVGFITRDGGLAWIDASGSTFDIVPSSSLPPNTVVNDFDWLPDGQGLVYTLADLSEQIGGSTLGIKYGVWVNDVDGSMPVLLADGARNAKVSPNGQTVAVLTGSGYADACFVDQRLAFLYLDPERAEAELVDMGDLNGFPGSIAMGSFFPLANVTWSSGQQALVEFGLTCEEDRSSAGWYLIDSQSRQMLQVRPPFQSFEDVADVESGGPAAGIQLTGIEVIDRAIEAILSNDLDARQELIHYTTAGCTTADGLGGPPKCEPDQADGTPVTYFPVLGPGEGSPVMPEDIDNTIDFVVKELYAAFRRLDPTEVDIYYPAGVYGLVFSFPPGDSLTGVTVRLDDQGRIIRLDFFIQPPETQIDGQGIELLIQPATD